MEDHPMSGTDRPPDPAADNDRHITRDKLRKILECLDKFRDTTSQLLDHEDRVLALLANPLPGGPLTFGGPNSIERWHAVVKDFVTGIQEVDPLAISAMRKVLEEVTGSSQAGGRQGTSQPPHAPARAGTSNALATQVTESDLRQLSDQSFSSRAPSSARDRAPPPSLPAPPPRLPPHSPPPTHHRLPKPLTHPLPNPPTRPGGTSVPPMSLPIPDPPTRVSNAPNPLSLPPRPTQDVCNPPIPEPPQARADNLSKQAPALENRTNLGAGTHARVPTTSVKSPPSRNPSTRDRPADPTRPAAPTLPPGAPPPISGEPRTAVATSPGTTGHRPPTSVARSPRPATRPRPAVPPFKRPRISSTTRTRPGTVTEKPRTRNRGPQTPGVLTPSALRRLYDPLKTLRVDYDTDGSKNSSSSEDENDWEDERDLNDPTYCASIVRINKEKKEQKKKEKQEKKDKEKPGLLVWNPPTVLECFCGGEHPRIECPIVLDQFDIRALNAPKDELKNRTWSRLVRSSGVKVRLDALVEDEDDDSVVLGSRPRAR